MMGRVLGLDGGGTKTIAVVIGPDGRVLAHETGTGLDPTAGLEWEARLKGFADRLGAVDGAVLGLPYQGEIPEISARQARLGQALFGPACRVLNDVAVAFEGAFESGDGVLILSGTGSMAWARGPQGTVRVGGWGDAFGDEGSAHWIGRAALAAISRHLDGRQICAEFAISLLQRIGITGDDLIAWTYGQTNPRTAIAGIARAVSALADAGVAEAQAILRGAADHLAEHGKTAARLGGAASPPRWAIAGGVMQDRTLRTALIAAMGCPPVPARLPPVGGAALLAARGAGWTIDHAFLSRLSEGLAGTPRSVSESV